MPRKPGFVSTLMLLLVVTLVSGFRAYSVKADGWVHYVPGEDQISFDYSKSNGTSYVDISIYFGSSGYNVSDWDSPTIVGTNISVDAEIWMWTGISFPLDMWVSHQYNLGNLTSGQYVFSFRVWTYPVKDNTFIVPIIVPDDHPTIQEAINAASDGDTVFVRNGTYSGPITIDRPMTLEGENKFATIMDGNGEYGGVFVNVLANNVRINGFTIQHASMIMIAYYANLTVSDNIMIDNFQGIRLIGTSGDVISGNFIDGNSAGAIGFDWVNDSVVSNNTLTNSGGLGAIHAGNPSYNITFLENTIIGNIHGIELNNIFDDCRFFHNNLINNTVQTVFSGPAKLSSWDSGYPSGGNYWSDYSGNDTYSGPYQNETGSDGIADTQYVIDANNMDHFPLMTPWTPPDIGVANLSTSNTIVGQGFPMGINATIHNEGNKVEAFTMNVYLNSSLLSSENCTIISGSLNLARVWNITGFGKGSYAVTVSVEPLQDELNIMNNNMTAHVFITISGDLNGDKTVDIYDAIIIANHFGFDRYHPSWNSNVDINNDGIIDIYDAIVLAANFGKSWT